MVRPLLPACDLLELVPEITWGVSPDGGLVFNGFADAIQALAHDASLPLVGHGLGYSPGTVSDDRTHQQRWLPMIAASQERFRFLWYLEHLGVSEHARRQAVLPLPIPRHPAVTRAVARSLADLRAVNPHVGFENSAWYFHLDEDEPAHYTRLLEAGGGWLLLDLHNAWTHCRNRGAAWLPYLERMPFERVLCVHVSGGSESPASWLASGRRFWLDAHDAGVPEPVWDMLSYVLPRCPNLRAVVVERMEGTFGPGDVPGLRAELDRARALWRDSASKRRPAVEPLEATPSEDTEADVAQDRLLQAVHSPAPTLDGVDPEGLVVTSLIVQKSRFERLLRGDSEAGAAFAADPPAFVDQFHHYMAEIPATAWFPAEESRLYRSWREGH